MNKEIFYLLLFGFPIVLFYIALFRKRRLSIYEKDPYKPGNAEYWTNKGYTWDPIQQCWIIKTHKFQVPKI